MCYSKLGITRTHVGRRGDEFVHVHVPYTDRVACSIYVIAIFRQHEETHDIAPAKESHSQERHAVDNTPCMMQYTERAATHPVIASRNAKEVKFAYPLASEGRLCPIPNTFATLTS